MPAEATVPEGMINGFLGSHGVFGAAAGPPEGVGVPGV